MKLGFVQSGSTELMSDDRKEEGGGLGVAVMLGRLAEELKQGDCAMNEEEVAQEVPKELSKMRMAWY